MEDLELARICADLADDKKAENIRILDLRGLSPVTDWFVLCSALSSPQLRAVRDHIEDELKERHKLSPLYRDGSYDSQWIILDYGNVMIHVLTPEKRDYYSLEELWGDAPELEWRPEAPAAEPAAKPKAARKKPAAKKAAVKKSSAKRPVAKKKAK